MRTRLFALMMIVSKKIAKGAVQDSLLLPSQQHQVRIGDIRVLLSSAYVCLTFYRNIWKLFG